MSTYCRHIVNTLYPLPPMFYSLAHTPHHTPPSQIKVNSSRYWLISPYFLLASILSGILSLCLSASLSISENFHNQHHNFYTSNSLTYLTVPLGFAFEVLIIRTIFVGCGGSGIPAAMIMYHKDPDPLSNASKYVSLRILIGKFLLTWFTLWLGGSAGKVRSSCEGKGLSILECLLMTSNPLSFVASVPRELLRKVRLR